MASKFLFGKLKMASSSKEKSATETGNPYVLGMAGKEEWNDRYMKMKNEIKAWKKAFASIVVLAIILSIFLGKLATESHIQPVAVEVSNGDPKGFLPVTSNIPNADKLVKFAIGQFIVNSRTVIADAQAEKALLDKVYAYSADNTMQFLHDYYQANNPFDIAAQSTVQVELGNPIQLSPNTWQITWDEIKKNSTGDSVISKTHWMATLTYRFGEVNEKFINDNPFGIYITQVSWSQIPNE